MNIFLNTNIVLRNSLQLAADHVEIREAITRVIQRGDVPCIAAQTIYETWVVATRPIAVNGIGLSPAEARVEVRVMLRTYRLLPDPSDLLTRWLRLCTQYAVSGRPAHDARLVALMLSHGIDHLLTLNPGDFTRYSEITCLAPVDV